MKFIYGSGQRPLDGYTIKRGVGKGGFGEVYFAVSDGGKEVALKLVRGDSDIELRGIAQCLNLKHPNLVSLFDLRSDSESNQWVVMEYVAGEALHMVLNRHPQGLPLELTKQWFKELARAVGYLHRTEDSRRSTAPPRRASCDARPPSATPAADPLEARRRAAEMMHVEVAGHLRRDSESRALPWSAQPEQMIDQRLRQIALLAVLAHAGCAVALRKRRAVPRDDQ